MTWRPPQGALGELCAGALEDCAARRKQRPGLAGEVERSKRPRGGFAAALMDRTRSGFPLICEVKRSSPSVGKIREGADAPMQAQAYANAGARCVSVLTEGRRFGGSLEDLRQVRAKVAVPLLRKDFVVDPYMIYEAAEAGADCVLLIAAALEPSLLRELDACARSLGLDVLLELIYERDLDSVEQVKTPLMGINARDLETLEVDADRFARMAPGLVQPGRLLVAESGVSSPADIVRLKAAGAGAALVGEALMRAEDPSQAVRALVEAGG